MAKGGGLGIRSYSDVASPGAAPPRPGGGPNWTCGSCGMPGNFASRTHCRGCGSARPKQSGGGANNKQENYVLYAKHLEKELAKANATIAQAAPQKESEKDKESKGPSIQQLEKSLKRAEKEEDEDAVAYYTKRLAGARAMEPPKPARQLRNQLGHTLNRKEAKLERSKKILEAIHERMALDAERLLQATAEVAKDTLEVEVAKAEYQDFNRAASTGGGEDQAILEESEGDNHPAIVQARKALQEALLQRARERKAEQEKADVDEGGDSTMDKDAAPAAPTLSGAAAQPAAATPQATAATEPTPQAAPRAHEPAAPEQQAYPDEDIKAKFEAVLYDTILAGLTKDDSEANPEQLAEEAKMQATKRADDFAKSLEKRTKIEQRP